jgi:hypothetical protein
MNLSASYRNQYTLSMEKSFQEAAETKQFTK